MSNWLFLWPINNYFGTLRKSCCGSKCLQSHIKKQIACVERFSEDIVCESIIKKQRSQNKPFVTVSADKGP